MSSAENGKPAGRLTWIDPALEARLLEIASGDYPENACRTAGDVLNRFYAAPDDPAEAILSRDPYPEDREGARAWAERVLRALGVPPK